MTLTPQWLDELRSRITLSSLIGQTVKLTRAGREHKGCCPFHQEKTPSFTINDEKGFYHCFGCSAHGDAIRWMTEKRGLAFMDAVKELAASAGMTLPPLDPKAAHKQKERQSLRDVTQAAAKWFEEQLQGLQGAEAREYLKRRGVSDALRRDFELGFAPDSWSKLKQALGAFPVGMLIEAGMLIAPQANPKAKPLANPQASNPLPYDRFRGRLMIPIRDARGRVIAFGGRILGDGEPKYLNSPDTPLFDKSHTLYNLDRAAQAARQTKRIILVEGYMDVIALAGAGVTDVTAPLGTALTEAQLVMLWRMVNVPILCFDGDAAGQKAAIRAALRALPLLRPGYSLAFAAMPPGQDPDDIVQTHGVAGFEKLLKQAEPLVLRLWKHELAQTPLATPEERTALKQRLFALADTIEHSDVRYHYRADFQTRFDALFAQARRYTASFARAKPAHGRSNRPERLMSDSRLQPLQDRTRAISQAGLSGAITGALLGGLLRYPVVLRRNHDALGRLAISNRDDLALLEALLDAAMQAGDTAQELDTDSLIAMLEETKMRSRALTLLRADGVNFSFNREANKVTNEAEYANALRDLEEFLSVLVEQPEIRAQLAQLAAHFEQTMNEDGLAEQKKLYAMEREMTQRLSQLADSRSE